MSAKSQVAHLFVAPPEDTLRGELSTIANWSQTLSLASDERAGVGQVAAAAAAAGVGATCYWRGTGTAAAVVTATAVGAEAP